jgi:WXG100 family type VII secretion target
MAEQIQVNFALLGQSADTLNTTAKNLQGYMQTLKSDLQAMYGSWLGNSSDAAKVLINKLINETDDVASHIATFSTQVHSAQETQQQLEQQITGLFSNAQ